MPRRAHTVVARTTATWDMPSRARKRLDSRAVAATWSPERSAASAMARPRPREDPVINHDVICPTLKVLTRNAFGLTLNHVPTTGIGMRGRGQRPHLVLAHCALTEREDDKPFRLS